ncbi:MAG: glycosyltransferase family 25 protein [Pseudomonadota bacterium]
MTVQGFFINLDRVPERADHMRRELDAAGLHEVERFSACDARAGLDAAGYAPQSWGEYWTLKPSEIACFESHIALWQKIAAGDAAKVVFEDDILTVPSLGAAVDALSAAAGAFDLIKLDGAPGAVRLGPVNTISGLAVRPILQALSSSAAYLLSPDGARKLLDVSDQYCDHLDDFISRPRPGWRAFQLVPALAVQGMFASPEAARRVPGAVAESERTSDTLINTGYDKGPTSYRLWKELRRARRRAARALWADRKLAAEGGLVGEIPLSDGLGAYRSG